MPKSNAIKIAPTSKTRPAPVSQAEVADLVAAVTERLSDHRTLHKFLVALALMCEQSEDVRDDNALWEGLSCIIGNSTTKRTSTRTSSWRS
jgi:hypothetical protein